jgi:RNA polymerase sigma-70 factor, ECF subfamily
VQEVSEDRNSDERQWLLRQAWKLCQGLPNAADLAQDLVQTTFLNYFESYGRNHELSQGERRGLLATILSNRFIDFCRKRRRQAQVQGLLPREEPTVSPDELIKPDWACVNQEQLGEAIHSLSDVLRQTYLLHARDMRNKDIAVALGVTETNVAKRLHVARKQIFQFLKRFTH